MYYHNEVVGCPSYHLAGCNFNNIVTCGPASTEPKKKQYPVNCRSKMMKQPGSLDDRVVLPLTRMASWPESDFFAPWIGLSAKSHKRNQHTSITMAKNTYRIIFLAIIVVISKPCIKKNRGYLLPFVTLWFTNQPA